MCVGVGKVVRLGQMFEQGGKVEWRRGRETSPRAAFFETLPGSELKPVQIPPRFLPRVVSFDRDRFHHVTDAHCAGLHKKSRLPLCRLVQQSTYGMN